MNKSIFRAAYLAALQQAVVSKPQDYQWPKGLTVETVAGRMFAAMDKGSFNHDSHAYRLATKALGIKFTRKAIVEFWNA